jgi:hypothetical protein
MLRLFSIPLTLLTLIAGYYLSPSAAQAQPAQPKFCTEIFQPVCARTKTGTLQTFGNACTARAAGATVVSQGACHFFCPLIWQPVCGRKDGVNRTYANSCTAMANGAVVLADGQCPGRICPRIFLPVCGVDPSGKLTTYSNRCIAINRGAPILHNGKC